RWTLLPGEELSKPAPIVDAGSSGDPVLPTGVSVYAAPVPGSGGSAVRMEAPFDPSPRPDHRYEFYVQFQGETNWRPMVVVMDDQIAYSDTVPSGQTHKVRWRTVTTGGKATAYTDPPVEVEAVADTSPTGLVSGVS